MGHVLLDTVPCSVPAVFMFFTLTCPLFPAYSVVHQQRSVIFFPFLSLFIPNPTSYVHFYGILKHICFNLLLTAPGDNLVSVANLHL